MAHAAKHRYSHSASCPFVSFDMNSVAFGRHLDKTGKLFRAKQVSISTAFADQIISNGQLVVPTIAIRYLHGSNEQIDTVATADADRQCGRARTIGYFGAVIALIGVIGAIVFGFNWVRRFGQGRAV